jgi:glutathione S-transferase
MRALWLLHELGIQFDVELHPFDKLLRSDDYLKINPAGRVPALELDGEIVCESGAIAEVLCERFSPDDLGRTPGHPERAQWLNWLHFAETISQHAAALTQQHIALYDASMRSPIVTKLEARRLEKCYLAVENQLNGREYLLKSGFTAADISVGQAIYMARHFARLDGFPNTGAWYDRITARAAFQASLPPEGATLLWPRDFYEPLDG